MGSFFDVYFSGVVVNHKYYNLDLPFTIEASDFINWLSSTEETIYEDNYGMTVCGLCEYSCLWISKLAHDINFDPSRLKVCYGQYGYGEHYWIMLDDKWFIDLTLAQFEGKAPNLAITKKSEVCGITTYSIDFHAISYIKYLEQFF